jgi:signal transduction histidine kinase
VRALRGDLEPFRLSAALERLAAQSDDTGLTVTVDCEGDERPYGHGALTALYRAAQEGLTNARRHARAGRVDLRLRCGRTHARLTVADDGTGFDAAAEGYGLTGVRERIGLVGGALDVDTAVGAGTRLTVTVPREDARWAGTSGS